MAEDWLSKEPTICGEVRGRVLDAETGRPIRGAYITDDSTPGSLTTDSLGQFRLRITKLTPGVPQSMRPARLRVRQIGRLDLTVHLPTNLGYVVEILLAPRQLHVDHISTVRIKDPGFCAHAS